MKLLKWNTEKKKNQNREFHVIKMLQANWYGHK